MHSLQKFCVRTFCLVAILLLAVLPMIQNKQTTRAGTISSAAISVASSTESASTTYTITFTPATAATEQSSVSLGFQSPPDTKFGINNAAVATGSSAVFTGIGFLDTQYGGISVNASSLPAEVLTLKLSGITNPSKAGKYSVWIETRSGFSSLDSGSASVTIGTIGVQGTVSLPGNAGNAQYVYVEAQDSTDFGIRFGSSTDENGEYGIGGLTSGKSYTIQVFLSGDPNSNTTGYASPEPATITYAGTPITQNFTLAQATKSVSGTMVRSTSVAVANGRVAAMRMDGPGFVNTTTNSAGEYSMTMTGGKWEIRPDTWVGPGQVAPDYTFSGPGNQIKFVKDSSVETKTGVNFTVIIANSIITGTVSPVPSGGMAGIGIHNRGGFGTGTQLQSNGTFSARVPAGVYEIELFTDMRQNSGDKYMMPSMDPVSVGSNETKNVGTITLVKMDKTITATVKESVGSQGLPNMMVGCFRPRGGGFSMGMTDSNGSASIPVTAGEWGCMANGGMGGPKGGEGEGGGPGGPGGPAAFLRQMNFIQTAQAAETQQESTYVIMGGPQFVKITDTATIAFSAVIADKTISVIVADPDGNPVQEFGFIEAEPTGSTDGNFGKGGGLGAPIDPNMPGMASIKVPAGVYDLRMMTPPGSDYSSGDPVSVDVTAGNATATIRLLLNDSTISGTLKDEDGVTVTGVMAFVSATNSKGGFIPGDTNSSTGAYSMRVPSAGGALNLGYFVDPDSGYFQQPFTDATVTPVANATATKNIVMKKATATVNVTVKDPDGNAVANAFVEADNRKAEKITKMDHFFNFGNKTDADGKVTLRFPADTFKFKAFLSPETLRANKWMPPKSVEYTLAKNSTTDVTLTFQSANVVLSGTVSKSDGTAVSEAFITAYSNNGESIEVPTGTDGKYSVNITSGEWHIVAEKDETTTSSAQVTPLISNDVAIDTSASTTITSNLTVTAGDALSTPLTSTFDSDNSKAIRFTDGALNGTVISIPQDALDSDGTGDNVTITAQSTVEVPRQLLDKPLGGAGVDITAQTSQGQSVTSANSTVAITIPVERQDMENAGLTLSDFGTKATMSYYDEENGKWAPVEGSVTAIEKDFNEDGDTTDATDQILVTGQTSHFTTFAVTAATDTIAPSAPTGITATAGAEKVTLSWTNPTDADFTGIKIYRSTTSGTVGDLVTTIASTTTASYENTGLTGGTKYYFVVRSYDSSGNISINTAQVNATPTASTALPATGANMKNFIWMLLLIIPLIGLGIKNRKLRLS